MIFRHGFDAKVTDKGLISIQKLRFENPRVGGSIPPPGTTFLKEKQCVDGLAVIAPRQLIARDCAGTADSVAWKCDFCQYCLTPAMLPDMWTLLFSHPMRVDTGLRDFDNENNFFC